MSQSQTSLPTNDNGSTTSFTASSNESTAALIPKPLTTQADSSNPASPSPAQSGKKDFEAAYGQLATSLGFGGGVPQLPPKKSKKKASGKGEAKPSAADTAKGPSDKTTVETSGNSRE